MKLKEILLQNLGGELKELFKEKDELFFKDLKEIRLRIGRPLCLYLGGGECFLRADGLPTRDPTKAFCCRREDIEKSLELMSDYSLYALEEELKNGYITLAGGHRVGICGKAVVEDRRIRTIKQINGMNIRLSHEIIGCGDALMPWIANKHTMIISPPCCGKTTLLRDIVRNVSNGCAEQAGQTVAVVDERSEIAGSYKGEPQNDVGIRTDVLDACPKEEGMLMLLRAMSPRVIAVDEIGRQAEINAIEDIVNAGIRLICSVHGHSLDDVRNKPLLGPLIEKKVFERFIVLSGRKGAGTLEGVFDETGNCLCS